MVSRIGHLPQLVVGTGIDIVRGTVDVARAVLSPRIPREENFVTIPSADRTPSGVVVSGLLNTLSPGSVLIDIDPEAETWMIHAINASDEDALIEDVQTFYERYQRPIWP
jgi:multisubunit Na+/H+ antiporter MnhE subunit